MLDKISIIVPVYNLENYIAQTLDSLLSQDYHNVEIIVVDDGSKDLTWEIICDYAKRDNRILPFHQENTGVFRARINGLKHITGSWVAFVDGDDTVDKDIYTFLYENANKYNADISHCGYKAVFEDGSIKHFYNTGQTILQDRSRGLIDLLEASIIEPSLCNKLFKSELIQKLLNEYQLDYSIKNYEDLLINFILFLNSKKSIFVDKSKYSYINRRDSASKNKSVRSFLDTIKVKETIISLSPKYVYDYAIKSYLYTCINAFTFLSLSDVESEQSRIIRNKIIINKRYIKLLNIRGKLSGYLICFSPFLYRFLYIIAYKLLK